MQNISAFHTYIRCHVKNGYLPSGWGNVLSHVCFEDYSGNWVNGDLTLSNKRSLFQEDPWIVFMTDIRIQETDLVDFLNSIRNTNTYASIRRAFDNLRKPVELGIYSLAFRQPSKLKPEIRFLIATALVALFDSKKLSNRPTVEDNVYRLVALASSDFADSNHLLKEMDIINSRFLDELDNLEENEVNEVGSYDFMRIIEALNQVEV